jgi:DNA-binding NtrC family response regulator
MGRNPRDYTILIADKSRDTRDVVYEVLRAAGYNCLLAADGLEAMDLFRHARPQLVIAGARLQIVSGVELMKHVCLKDPDIAVILMSGAWGGNWRRDERPVPSISDCYRLGAYKVLTKPVNVDELLIYAERALERRQLLIERRQRLAASSA